MRNLILPLFLMTTVLSFILFWNRNFSASSFIATELKPENRTMKRGNKNFRFRLFARSETDWIVFVTENNKSKPTRICGKQTRRMLRKCRDSTKRKIFWKFVYYSFFLFRVCSCVCVWMLQLSNSLTSVFSVVVCTCWIRFACFDN